MYILGIESSCDDTSIALIKGSDLGIEVLAEKTASQIDIHKKYGGVIPEIAGRKHAEKIIPVIEEVLSGHPKPDAIAVTSGPGLMTGLLVGVEVAKTLSYLWDVPLVKTNHIEGHIYSVLLQDPQKQNNEPAPQISFPAVALIVSGGHTEFILMKDHGEYQLIGKTRDDAAGEAFDKVAKLLDLEYPGGPKISKLAETGNTQAIPFPRPMIDSDSLDMSFSGLKTAVLYYLRDHSLSATSSRVPLFLQHLFGQKGTEPTIHDVCASFEQAVTDVLVTKMRKAIKLYAPKTIILSGGVSANKKIRAALAECGVPLLTPPLKYCMDNGTMIAVAGYLHAKNQDITDWKKIEANPVWRIYQKD